MTFFYQRDPLTDTNSYWENLQGENRPKCSVPHCDNLAASIRTDRNTGIVKWRKSKWIKDQYPDATDTWCCSKCHNDNIAKRHQVKSAKHLTAHRHCMSITEYQHQFHPYLKYRKTYCENQDGRLGFVCTTNIFWQGMLQVDHIDGDHTNNNLGNLQTLCACCHAYKSWKNKDYLTPGRKTRAKT